MQALGSAAIPEGKHVIPQTSRATIDQALSNLRDKKDEWAQLSIDRRIDLLRALLKRLVDVAPRWVEVALEAKKITKGSTAEAEEWLGGPALLIRNVQLLIRTLSDIKEHGHPVLADAPKTLSNGQLAVPVYPLDHWDKLLLSGYHAEVWMEPGVTAQNLYQHMAEFYRQSPKTGKVALVLGAGNVANIGPMDALYKLFAEGQVVLLKMNPVNEYLGPVLEDAFADFVRLNYFHVVYGGAAEGAYLSEHPLVDEIHITGSDKTHDAIMFGVGAEGAQRKANRQPKNNKRITSELGNVSPMIVVPGPWSASDLAYQGVNLASSLCNNAGFNCNATRVIVQHENWEEREALLDATRDAFKHAEARYPYYPGAEERYRNFVDQHPNAERFGGGELPWTLISHLDPNAKDDICFNREAFCGVIGEVALPANSVVEFIDKAVQFCNDDVWGTLNAGLIVHPKSLRDPEVAKAVERAIQNLKYGSVVINHWPALSYGLVSTTWGAYPGHTIDDVRSGIGVVHNTLLFDRPQKSVVYGPFRAKPKPPWFVNHRTAADLARKITYMYADPSAARIPGILWSALRG